MGLAITSPGPLPGSCGMRGSAGPQLWRKRSIAEEGRSFGFSFALRFQLAYGLFQFSDIIWRGFARFGQLRDHGLGAASEEAQNFIKNAVTRYVAGNYWL